MKLQIEKLKRDKYGPKSERASRLLDQMAFELEDLEGTATENELAAERAAAKTTNVAPFTRNRQAERYAREGVPLSLSTLADQVGACCAVLDPIIELLIAHAFASGRVHGDNTTRASFGQGQDRPRPGLGVCPG